MEESPTTARRVLFVCAGNTCRSPMAAVMARQLLGETVRAESAGISADDDASATKDALRAMKERALDISGHRSRSFRTVNLKDFDLLVALTPGHRSGCSQRRSRAFESRDTEHPGPLQQGSGRVSGDRWCHRARSQEVVSTRLTSSRSENEDRPSSRTCPTPFPESRPAASQVRQVPGLPACSARQRTCLKRRSRYS